MKQSNNPPRTLSTPWIVKELEKHWASTSEFDHSGYENFKTERRAKLAEFILELNPRSILEIGCLGGYNLREIHKLDSSVELTGYDINKPALEYAKSKLDAMETIHGSIYDLSSKLKGRKFDVIFTAGVLIHIPNWDESDRSTMVAATGQVIAITKGFLDTKYITNIVNSIYDHTNLGIVHAEEHGESFSKKPNTRMRYIHNFNELYQDKGTIHIDDAPDASNGFEHFVKVTK